MNGHRNATCMALALISAATCLHAAESTDLTRLRAQFDKDVGQVRQEAQGKETRINEQYLRSLDSLMQTLTRAGNLDAALAVRDEKNRVTEVLGTANKTVVSQGTRLPDGPHSDEGQKKVVPLTIPSPSTYPQTLRNSTNRPTYLTDLDPNRISHRSLCGTNYFSYQAYEGKRVITKYKEIDRKPCKHSVAAGKSQYPFKIGAISFDISTLGFKSLSGKACFSNERGAYDVEKNPCSFVIKGDNNVLWESGVFDKPTAQKTFMISVEGISILKFEIEPILKGNRPGNCVWFEPVLE